MTRLRSALAIASAAGLTGCAVGPNYHAPQLKLPDAFIAASQASGAAAKGSTSIDPSSWWHALNDPQLDSLIERAIQANPSLEIALTRLQQARTFEAAVTGQALPVLEASAGAARGTGSNLARGRASAPLISATNTQGLDHITQVFGFDAAWEIDVFGGTRRTIQAADADYEASIEARRDTYVRLLAEIARNYVELRQFQNQIRIATENLKTQQASLSLTQERFRAGVTTQLDVSRAQAQVAATAAGIPSLDAQMHQTIHRISVLLGEQPAALTAELTQPGTIPGVPDVVPVGVPTDLLRRRPDIRRAERELASATARIGAATADLYPKFQLIGTFGFDASEFKHMFDWGSRYWSIGPSITWPVFNAGRIRANIQTYNEAQQQALTTYEQTVLQAMEDVEDSLVAYSREQMRRQALADSVAANKQSVDLATQQYRQGVVDFLTVLEAQRSLFLAEDELARSDAQIASNLVALYKAMGGGWEVEPPPPEKAAS